MASAAYVTARSRVFVAVFAGMRIDLPDMTRWAIVTPVSYFSILLLVLALILAIKEFVLPNKRLKFRLNILGIFLMAAIIVAWIEAIITPFMSILWTVSKE